MIRANSRLCVHPYNTAKSQTDIMTNHNSHALDYAQDPKEMLEIMHAPSIASSSSSSSSSCPPFAFDPYVDLPITTGRREFRSVAHGSGLWHCTCHVWIVDDATGTILLQRRSSTKDTFPGRWDISCAGHVGTYTSPATVVSSSSSSSSSYTSSMEAGADGGVADSGGGGPRRAALAELSEELGMNDVSESELALSFVIPACMSDAGGCNAYEHVYFLVRDGGSLSLSLGYAEVDGVTWRPAGEVLDALRSGDVGYAPRTAGYVSAMEGELDRIIKGRKI
jgi:isopentenyldiphosphate isomerase